MCLFDQCLVCDLTTVDRRDPGETDVKQWVPVIGMVARGLRAHRSADQMTTGALQIDFNPQPKGIAVVCSTPISEITGNGNYSALQDLLDGYATEFQQVHVFAPGKPESLNSRMDHRINWIHGRKFGSSLTALSLSGVANRKLLKDVELIRTFGPAAGLAGRLYGRIAKAPVVSSLDDLAGNRWRESRKLRSKLLNGENKFGPFSAEYISAKHSWETELLSEMSPAGQILIEPVGIQTDIYSPSKLIDPARNPIVLWAIPLNTDENLNALFTTAERGSQLIPDINFVAIGDDSQVQVAQNIASERDLPVTALKYEEVEPLVDLIERSWACVTAADNGFPSGLAMLSFSAGVPVISTDQIDEAYGFKNHLNYVEITDDSADGVAFGLNMLRNWNSFALRVARSGQSLIESRYSTLAVARREAERLADIANGIEVAAAVSTSVESPNDVSAQSVAEQHDTELADDAGGSDGFDLVAAALSDLHGGMSSDTSIPSDSVAEAGSEEPMAEQTPMQDAELSQDAISALFAEPESPESEPAPDTSSNEEMSQDAISALFAGTSADEENVESNGEPLVTESSGVQVLSQDLISALFAADELSDEDSEPAPETPVDEGTGEMDQDAISALFAANSDSSDGNEDTSPSTPNDEDSGVVNQDAISALFAGDELTEELTPEPESTEPETSSEMGQDAISALFETESFTLESDDSEPGASSEMGEDAISALFEESASDATNEPADSGEMDQDAISALFGTDGDLNDSISSDVIDEPVEDAPGADLEDLEEDVQVVQVTIGDEDEEVEPEFMVESFDEIEVEDELDVDALIEAAKHDEELV